MANYVSTHTGSQIDEGVTAALHNNDVLITSPSSATSGTITSNDLAKLQGDKGATVTFAGEVYTLADDQTAAGYLVYTHAGQDNTQTWWVKCITLTISTRAWALTKKEVSEGGGSQLYLHRIGIYTTATTPTASKPVCSLSVMLINNSSTPISTYRGAALVLYDIPASGIVIKTAGNRAPVKFVFAVNELVLRVVEYASIIRSEDLYIDEDGLNITDNVTEL